MLPCSQSIITQSTPDLANILEILAPGSICQRPMLGPLFSVNAVFRWLDFCVFESDLIVDILEFALDVKRLVTYEVDWRVVEHTPKWREKSSRHYGGEISPRCELAS